jgi:hypothetical protein
LPLELREPGKRARLPQIGKGELSGISRENADDLGRK